MFKKFILGSLLIGLIAILLVGAVNRTQARSAEPAGQESGQGQRGRWGQEPAGAPAVQSRGPAGPETEPGAETHPLLPAADPAGLTQADSDGLLFMYEEEKLARDVYAALYAQWGAATFQNVSASEQQHMDAVRELLDRYGLAVPAPAEPGQFANADLQALYAALTARGAESLAEAYRVGGAIEELDLQDLDAQLAQSGLADIRQVYASLRRGSENHLRAFARALQNQTGEAYQPQYLSADDYAALAVGEAGQGRGGHGGADGGGYRGGRP